MPGSEYFLLLKMMGSLSLLRRIFSFVPLDHIVPPGLHLLTLGMADKGIFLVRDLNMIYKTFGIEEKHFNGTQYNGPAIMEIVKRIDELLTLLNGKPEKEPIKKYFELLKPILKHGLSIKILH